MLNWLCTRSSSVGGCSMQVWLGVQACSSGCMLDWLGVHLPSILCIVLDLAVGVVVCKASVLNWLGVSICLLYICIVLDLAVGVMVCKASIFNWLCTGIQGIYAQFYALDWLGGGRVHLPSIYMHCTRSSSGCSGMQSIYLQLTVYWYSRQLCSIDWGSRSTRSVCKASVLIDWWGPSGTISSSGCRVCKASVLIDWGCPSAFYIYALY